MKMRLLSRSEMSRFYFPLNLSETWISRLESYFRRAAVRPTILFAKNHWASQSSVFTSGSPRARQLFSAFSCPEARENKTTAVFLGLPRQLTKPTRYFFIVTSAPSKLYHYDVTEDASSVATDGYFRPLFPWNYAPEVGAYAQKTCGV